VPRAHFAQLRTITKGGAMNKKKAPKKLQLTKETLRSLEDEAQLRLLAGGGSWRTCTTECSYCTP
jgi:hypothetical protein